MALKKQKPTHTREKPGKTFTGWKFPEHRHISDTLTRKTIDEKKENWELFCIEKYLRDDFAVNVKPSSQSSGKFCLSSSSTVSLRTSLM